MAIGYKVTSILIYRYMECSACTVRIPLFHPKTKTRNEDTKCLFKSQVKSGTFFAHILHTCMPPTQWVISTECPFISLTMRHALARSPLFTTAFSNAWYVTSAFWVSRKLKPGLAAFRGEKQTFGWIGWHGRHLHLISRFPKHSEQKQ